MDGADIMLPHYPAARRKNAGGLGSDVFPPGINGVVLVRIFSSMGVIYAFP